MKRDIYRNVVGCVLLCVLLPTATFAVNRNVGPGQDYATIQSAIDAAAPMDMIIVHDGTYVENLVVDRPLTIRSLDYINNRENDGAVLDASDIASTLHGIEVLVPGVTIEGLSIHGALGMTADYLAYRSAIVLRDAHCVVAHNRLGWDDDHENSIGLWLDDADNTLVDGNEILGVMHGIWMITSRECTFTGNDVHGAGNATYSGGLYIYGDYSAPDPGGSSGDNLFVNNRFHDNFLGIHLLDTVWRCTFLNNEFDSNYAGVYVKGGSRRNVFTGNHVHDNGHRGFHLLGTEYNLVTGNTIDNNVNGIWLGYQSPSDYGAFNHVIRNNRIINNTYAGIRISANSLYNRMSLNMFAGNASNVISEGTEWATATPVSYYHGANHNNQLGNYYDTYSGTDLDGDGVGDTDLPFIDGDSEYGPVEYFPLVAPPTEYRIQAWYAHGDAPLTMHRRKEATVPGQLEVPALGTLVWASDEPARTPISFANGAWTGLVSFVDLPGYDSFLVEVGSSSDGIDFTPSGAEVLIGADWTEPFTTSPAAVSVPEGHYLALRLTNTIDWPYAIRTGGTHLYLSSPGLDDPLWPSGWVGGVPTAGGRLVRLAQNHPNPFNPATRIGFELDFAATVQLAVYDLSGRHVRTLVAEKRLPEGRHAVSFDGRDHQDRPLAAGVYFYRLQADGEVFTRRMTLVK